MNIKKIIKTTLALTIALSIAIAVSYAQTWTPPSATAPAGNTPPPVNVGTTGQVKDSGLSVKGFSAYMNSWFDQNVSIKGSIGGVASTAKSTDLIPAPAPLTVSTAINGQSIKLASLASAFDHGRICSDNAGNVVRCTDITGCAPIKGSSFTVTKGTCPQQIQYHYSTHSGNGNWNSPYPSYTNQTRGAQLCVTAGWQTFNGGSLTISNVTSQAKNFLVIGEAYVGNDSGVDTFSYRLDINSITASGPVGTDQIMIDYAPANQYAVPASLRVMSVERVDALTSASFTGRLAVVQGSCGRIYGMKTIAIPFD